VAKQLKLRKDIISRIENHSEEIKLSTLERVETVLVLCGINPLTYFLRALPALCGNLNPIN